MTKKIYEEKLFEDLKKLEHNRWYKIHDRPDFDKMVTAIRNFIKYKSHIEISECGKNIRVIGTHEYNKMATLPQGVTIETIERGHVETFVTPKGQTIHLTHERTSYRTIFNGKIIQIA